MEIEWDCYEKLINWLSNPDVLFQGYLNFRTSSFIFVICCSFGQIQLEGAVGLCCLCWERLDYYFVVFYYIWLLLWKKKGYMLLFFLVFLLWKSIVARGLINIAAVTVACLLLVCFIVAKNNVVFFTVKGIKGYNVFLS